MAKRDTTVGVHLKADSSKFKAGAKDAAAATKQLQQELDRRFKEMNSASAQLNNQIKSLTSLLPALSAGFAAVKLAQFGKDLVTIASEAQGVQRAFNNLNDPSLLANLRRATHNTVSDLELMKRTIEAKNLGVPIKQLATFFEFAAKRAQDSGESVDYLVDSIVKGIGRQSVQIIDNLGISAAELREQLKLTPDFAEAVGVVIKRNMKESGEYIEDTGTKIAQLNAAWANFKLALSDSGFVRNATGIIGGLSDVVKILGADFLSTGEKIRALYGGFEYGEIDRMIDHLNKLGEAGRNAGHIPLLHGAGANVGITGGWSMMSTLKDIPTSKEIEDAVEIVEELKKLRTPLDAVQMWRGELIKPGAKQPALPVDKTGGIFSGESTLWGADPGQLSPMRALADDIKLVNEEMVNWRYLAYDLEGVFTEIFKAGQDGWEGFAKVAEDMIVRITQQLIARAAIWGILALVTGGSSAVAAKMGMGFTEYLTGGLLKSGSAGDIGASLKGRDIAISSARYGDILIKNT